MRSIRTPARSRSMTRRRAVSGAARPHSHRPAGGSSPPSTTTWAFGQMLLSRGKHGSERILSRPSVETMTTDQLTREQKTGSDLVTGYFDSHGWGFGLSVVTRHDDVAAPVGSLGRRPGHLMAFGPQGGPD